MGRRVPGEDPCTALHKAGSQAQFHTPATCTYRVSDPSGTSGLRRPTLRRSPDGRYQLLHGRRICSTIWRGEHPTCQSDFTGRCGEGISSVEEDRRGPGEAILVRFFRSLHETVLDCLRTASQGQSFSKAFLHHSPVRAPIEVEKLNSHGAHHPASWVSRRRRELCPDRTSVIDRQRRARSVDASRGPPRVLVLSTWLIRSLILANSLHTGNRCTSATEPTASVGTRRSRSCPLNSWTFSASRQWPG